MKTLLVTALREWSYFFRDRAAVLLLVAASLFYAFYYPLPYLHQIPRESPVGVVDRDNSNLSRQLIRYTDATEQIAVYEYYPDIQSAAKAMAGGKIFGILEIPADFERDIRRGGSTAVGLYGNAGFFMVYSAIGKGLSLAAGTISAGIKIMRLEAEGYSEKEAMVIRDAMPVSIQTLYNGSEGYGNYVVPAVLMVILQQTLVIGIGILGGARADRRLSVRNSKPKKPEPLYVRWIGRGLAYLIHYGLFFAFYYFIVYSVFGFPARAQILPLVFFVFAFVSASIQMGFFFAQFFKHRESSMQIFLYCSIPFLFVSGFSWPLTSIPEGLHILFWIVPTTHAIPAWLSVQQMGASLQEIAKPIIHLGILAIAYGSLGYLMQLWKERKYLSSSGTDRRK
ncbi:MAG: ABC transporter permease [Fibrobacter sp.]|jgi:ABC-2 type transport system permease protein|nr:ABC transporter permease [Fibrobacter sp.]